MKNFIEVWLVLCLITNRPGILFNVCLCTRFQSNPKEFHMLAIMKPLNEDRFSLIRGKLGICDLIQW